MESRFYQAQRLDLGRLAEDLERMFLSQGFQVQHFGNNDQMTVQIRKGGDFSAILGLQQALTLTMQRVPEGMNAVVGQEKWADKAAVGIVGMLVLWPLAFTAGAGAIQQAQLGNQVLVTLDSLVYQQAPDVRIHSVPSGPMPPNQPPGMGTPPPYGQPQPPYGQPFSPQYPQQPYGQPFPFQQSQPIYGQPYSPKQPPPQYKQPPFTSGPNVPPAVKSVICPSCQAVNDERDKFCMSCGKSLAKEEPPKTFCPSCHAETKPNATFCTQCGASLKKEETPGD